jgi:hypothetical protein
VALVVAAALTASCRAATLAYAPDAATARIYADAVAAAIEHRFTNVVRPPRFAAARLRIGRYAFAPSKLVADTTLWTARLGDGARGPRELRTTGALTNGSYTFALRERAPQLTRTGDSHHFIGLVPLADDGDWEWTATVDQAIGTMPPERATLVFRALVASAERSAAAIRTDYRSAFARTSAAFGRIATIDSLETSTSSDGATRVLMQLLLSNARIRGDFPALARYLDKYVLPATMTMVLADQSGREYLELRMQRGRIMVRFRSKDGVLQPLLGALSPMPDTLRLRVDATAKFGLFTVGFAKLRGDFVFANSASERAWDMRFRQEPDWQLPLISERLLRTPLRRPFEGDGIHFRLGVVRSANGVTLLSRSTRVAVRESAIMRFLGNLGFTAMNDFSGTVEEEEARFLSEGFLAMRRDIAALTGGPVPGESP